MLNNSLVSLVSTGNFNSFQNYLKHESSNIPAEERDDLLHVACRFGHFNIVKELLKLGANCGHQHPDNGRLPVHEVCRIGNVELVELMGKHSAGFINLPDKDGCTAAHICAMEGELESLTILKQYGAEVSAKDKDGMNLIHWASKRNHPSIIYYLVEMEENINEKCFNGKTALHYAAIYNNIDCLQLLIKCQADVTLGDNDGYTCIHMAAKHGSIECLRFLSSHGIPLDLKRANGKTPAHLASFQGFYECLHWLLDNGADISSVDDDGNSIGHYACRGGHGETLHCYLSHDGAIDLKNKLNEDVYQTARRYGHPIKFEKARKSEIVCPMCQLETNKRKWNQIHVLPSVVKAIDKSQKTLFKNPLGSFAKVVNEHQKNFDEKKMEINRKNIETMNIGKISSRKVQKAPNQVRVENGGYRDLITRFYGEYIHNK